jgi:hypothetical protein
MIASENSTVADVIENRDICTDGAAIVEGNWGVLPETM